MIRIRRRKIGRIIRKKRGWKKKRAIKKSFRKTVKIRPVFRVRIRQETENRNRQKKKKRGKKRGNNKKKRAAVKRSSEAVRQSR